MLAIKDCSSISSYISTFQPGRLTEDERFAVADDVVQRLAPPNGGSINSTHICGTHVQVEEPSTASLADIRRAAETFAKYQNQTFVASLKSPG
jgi:hypothetical protein